MTALEDFNPRSHRRERPLQKSVTLLIHDFNPRSHRRERHNQILINMTDKIFQPTLPPKGATPKQFTICYNWFISTHAPTEGSDADKDIIHLVVTVFQPTLPPKGATLQTLLQLLTIIYFNPRSHRRERR